MRILSKLKKPKVARILGGALGLLLALSLVLVPATPVVALPPPGHYFYGNVTTEGEPVAEETVITAEVAGLEYFTTVDALGKYGWHPNEFSIPGDDPDTPGIDGASADDEIVFYVGDIRAALLDVETGEWLDSYLFESGGTTELNLETAIDIIAPTVVGTTPEDGATNEAIDVVVSATFSENVTAVDLSGITLDGVSGVSATLDDKTATFTPDANLDYETTYTASVQASDLVPNAMAEAHTWSFTTVTAVDITPPVVLSTTPEADATNQAIDVVVSATFDEDIQAGDNFSGIAISGATGVSASINGVTLTIAHEDFAYETLYEVTIPAGAVNDLADNPLAEAKVWSFTTRAAGLISFTIPLPADWNLLSTPIKLDADSDSMGQIFDTESLSNIEIYYSWDAVSEQWAQVLTDYELLPLYTIYVKVSSGASATAEFILCTEISELPSRELQRGLNLIGPAPEAPLFANMPLDQALISIAEAESGFRGYTMVVSPAHNQTGWVYALGGEIQDLIPFKGYWVVMENADTLFGFSTTP